MIERQLTAGGNENRERRGLDILYKNKKTINIDLECQYIIQENILQDMKYCKLKIIDFLT